MKALSASIFVFCAVFQLFTAFAYAAGPLDFNAKISASSRLNINSFIRTNLKKDPADIIIAPADLNGDDLDEFILREKACDPVKDLCNFTIIAENGDKVTLLGNIPAHMLALDNGDVQGVRNIQAYKSGINDYQYDLYVWDPHMTRYMMKQ